MNGRLGLIHSVLPASVDLRVELPEGPCHEAWETRGGTLAVGRPPASVVLAAHGAHLHRPGVELAEHPVRPNGSADREVVVLHGLA